MNKESPALIKCPNGNTQVYFTSAHCNRWCELGLISRRLVDGFYEGLKRSQAQAEKLWQFKEKNPNASLEDFFGMPKILTQEESEHLRRDGDLQFEFHEFIVANWETLLAAISTETKTKLFREVDPVKNFGVVKVETNCCYHLRDLLDDMRARHRSDNDYTARGEVKSSKDLCIALEFDFRAKNQAEADSIVRKFREMMIGRGLKAWLGFWKVANTKGKSRFETRISDVMSLLSDKNRKSNFNDEERKEFWSIIRSLTSTRFVMEWPDKKSSGQVRKKNQTRFIQQPLLRILGGEKKLGEDCPIRIGVEVLTEEVAEERFAPAFLVNGTLLLHPNDIHFALVIQARAAQTGGKVIEFDWSHAFNVANVGGTAKSNPRKAKAAVRKKLDRFQEEAIIEGFFESRENVRITPQKHENSESKRSSF